MRKFSNKQKVAGELAMRRLSDKAAQIYNGVAPLEVYEYEKNGIKLYAYSGVFGDREDMTFDDIEKDFEVLFDEMEDNVSN